MHDVKCEFLLDAVAALPSLDSRSGRARDNFTVIEGDDIGRALNVHEPLVDSGDDAVRDDRDFDGLEMAQGKTPVGRRFRAVIKGGSGEFSQPRHPEEHRALAIVDLDRQAAETGGTVERAEGSGVCCLSVRPSG